MTFEKLRDRAVLGLEGNAIRRKAIEYIYDAEADMCLKAKCYQKNNLSLMVDPDNVNIVDLPSDFLEFSGLPEWKSVPLDLNPKWYEEVRRRSDGTWYTGTPGEYFLQNNQVFLNPQPSSYTGDNKLGIWYVASAPSTHSAVAEITNITTYDDLSGAEYLYISTTTVDYYVWFDLDNGSTDPSISGRTGVEIDVTTGQAAATIASALQVSLNALSGFSATVSGSTVTVTNGTSGAVKNIAEDVSTGFILNVTTEGQDAVTSPVIDASYHIYLYNYARWQLLIDDGRIKEGDYHRAIYEENRELIKRHFKSRSSPNVGRIRSSGVIRGSQSSFGATRSYVVHSETVSTTTTSSSDVTTTTTTDDTVTVLETQVIPTGTVKQIEVHVTATNADGSKTGTWTMTQTFQNLAGTVTATDVRVWAVRTRNDSDWDPSFVISGSSVEVRVQGGASESITWNSRTVVT